MAPTPDLWLELSQQLKKSGRPQIVQKCRPARASEKCQGTKQRPYGNYWQLPPLPSNTTAALDRHVEARFGYAQIA